MSQSNPFTNNQVAQTSDDVLTSIIREGAKRLITAALEAEVDSYIQEFASERDQSGRRMVVRNGYCPERHVQTGVGSVPVERPRVNDVSVRRGASAACSQGLPEVRSLGHGSSSPHRSAPYPARSGRRVVRRAT